MSYKRQIQAHYHNLINALQTISLPQWLVGREIRTGFIVFIIFLSVAYVLRMNSAATRGYEAHALEKQIVELNSDLQSLNIKIASAGSMVSIEKRLEGMNLIEVENLVRYNPSAVVALAR
jgi:hypothetical protein